MFPGTSTPPLGWALLSALLLAGCRQDMHDQPRYEALEASDFFADRASARAPVEGTVAWGRTPAAPDPLWLAEDELLFTGRSGASQADYATVFPFPITAAGLDRGQERYEVFCAVCHGGAGHGDGMVPRRGFRRPATLHSDRLREAPVGYLYDVIAQGFGVMPSYAAQIPVHDRWLIVAYQRALQLSQHARLEDVPAEQRSLLED